MVVGAAFTTGSVAATNGQGQGGVGYISSSSYGKLFGEDNVDCVAGEDGWGETFYIQQEAVADDFGESVLIDAPPSCNSNRPDQTFRGYRISAERNTVCTGGPSPDGDGPQSEDCCSWLFVNRNRNIRFDIEQRVTNIHTPIPCIEKDDVSVYDDGNGSFTDAFPLVRITFAPVTSNDQNRSKHTNGKP